MHFRASRLFFWRRGCGALDGAENQFAPGDRGADLEGARLAVLEVGQIEQHEVGRIAGRQTAGGRLEQRGGLPAGHVHGRCQIDAGKAHHVGHAHADRQRRAGQELFLTRDDQLSAGQHFHLAPGGRISARRQAGLPRDVAHQDAARGRFGADECLDHFRRQMMPIDDQARRQPVFGQLVPDVVGMAAHRAMRAVAQVRAQRRPGIHGRADLGRVGIHVADGHRDAAFHGAGNERRRLRILRRQRHQPDQAHRRLSASVGTLPNPAAGNARADARPAGRLRWQCRDLPGGCR